MYTAGRDTFQVIFARQGQRFLYHRGWGSRIMRGSWGANKAPAATGSGLICPRACCWDYWLFLTCSFSVPLPVAQTLFGVGRFSCWAIRVFTSPCSLVLSLDEKVQKKSFNRVVEREIEVLKHTRTHRQMKTYTIAHTTKLTRKKKKKRKRHVVHNLSFSG